MAQAKAKTKTVKTHPAGAELTGETEVQVETNEADKDIKKPTTAQQKELDSMTTISAKIRYLDKERFTRTQIANLLGKRYQHVRNVLETPLKRGPRVATKNKKVA